MEYIKNSFTFFKSAYKFNCPSILIAFHQFFIWNALNYVDLCFSLMLVSKVNATEEETK
jgi:hypothetical protein